VKVATVAAMTAKHGVLGFTSGESDDGPPFALG
jgi:hypothetical protein